MKQVFYLTQLWWWLEAFWWTHSFHHHYTNSPSLMAIFPVMTQRYLNAMTFWQMYDQVCNNTSIDICKQHLHVASTGQFKENFHITNSIWHLRLLQVIALSLYAMGLVILLKLDTLLLPSSYELLLLYIFTAQEAQMKYTWLVYVYWTVTLVSK